MTGWIWFAKRGRKALPPTTQHPEAIRPDDSNNSAGLERLQTDLCRALGRIYTRLSSVRSTLLGWTCPQDARVRGSRQDGLSRIAMSAVRCGHPSRRHELSIV